MREYSLNGVLLGSGRENYSVEEVLRDRKKRSNVFSTYKTIKELDEICGDFESYDDINDAFNKAYGTNEQMTRPFIIYDKSDDLSQSKAIFDVVYKEDYKEISKADNIKLWAIDYLKKNPLDIVEFSGIRSIYNNKYKEEALTGNLIERIVNSYFQGFEYSKVRSTYFTLKKLDGNKRKNEIHR